MSDHKRPREWWIQFTDNLQLEVFVHNAPLDTDNGQVIHVIEFSTYEQVLKERDECFSKYSCQVTALIAERDEARAQLKEKVSLDILLVSESYQEEINELRAKVQTYYETENSVIRELRAEVKRLKDVCATINRERNSFFDQSCKNFEKLTAAEALITKLVSALSKIQCLSDDDYMKSVTEDGEEELWVSDIEIQAITEAALAEVAKWKAGKE